MEKNEKKENNLKKKKSFSQNVLFLAICLIVLFGYFTIDKSLRNNSNIEMTGGTYTLLDLGSRGCEPCDLLKPVLEDLRNEYQAIININFFDTKTYDGAKKANKYKIIAIPTLLFIDENCNEILRLTGFHSYEEIKQKFIQFNWI
jgi:thioredoxin 1